MKTKKIITVCMLASLFATALFAKSLTADQKRQLDITQNSQKIRAKGKLPLYIEDSQTGLPVCAHYVTLYTEEGEQDFLTDKKGFVSLPKLVDGEYLVKIYGLGYITETQRINVKAGFITNYRFAVCKKLLDAQMRIVLQWGDRPADLDLHLEKEGGYHISYRNMQISEDGSANLDRDDTDFYGPETITVNFAERGVNYYIYVVDYTNRSNATAQALGGSGAVIKIYGGDELVNLFYVPEGKSGNRWNVCTIKDGDFSVNQTVVTNY